MLSTCSPGIPEQWRELAQNHSLVPSAVDELLRYRPITFSTSRQARHDVVYRDTLIAEGTLLLLTQGSANFDSAAYDAPYSFDIHRYVDGRRTPRPTPSDIRLRHSRLYRAAPSRGLSCRRP